jgi:hypothetical protein
MPRGHKGEPRTPGAGRKKGTPNRDTITVKSAVAKVFQDLQEEHANGKPKYVGVHLRSWAIAQPTEFYKIAARLIPTEVSGGMSHTVQIIKYADSAEIGDDQNP